MRKFPYVGVLLFVLIHTSCSRDSTVLTPTTDVFSPYVEFTLNNNTVKGIALEPYMASRIDVGMYYSGTYIPALIFDFHIKDSISNSFDYHVENLYLTGVTSSNLLLNNPYNANNNNNIELVTKTAANNGAYFLYLSTNPTNFCNVLITEKKYITSLGRYVLSGVINAKLKNAVNPFDTVIVMIKFKDIGFIK